MKKIQELLTKLELNNDVLSKFQLGYLYNTGNLVSRDDTKAFEYYQQAADINHPEQNNLDIKYKKLAVYNMGLMHFYGHGVTENKELALEIMMQIPKDGDPKANYLCGYVYAAGDGVEKDYKKAADHFFLAANENHAEAQFNLGKLYHDGLIRSTSKKNTADLAKKYFELAKKNGCTKAENYLNSLVSVWPCEDWDLLLNPNNCELSSGLLEQTLIPTGSFAPEAGKVYGNKNKCLIREEIKMLIKESEKSFFAKNKKEFSLEELLEKYNETFKTPIDQNLIVWLNMIIEKGLHYGHYIIGHYYLQEMHRHSFKLKKIFDALEADECIKEKHGSQITTSDYEKVYVYYILQYVRTIHSLKRAFFGGIESAKEDLDELKTYREHLNRIDGYYHDFYEFCLMSELPDKDNPEYGKIYFQEEAINHVKKALFSYRYIFKDLKGNKQVDQLEVKEKNYKGNFTKQILDDEKSNILEKISNKQPGFAPRIYRYKNNNNSECLHSLYPTTTQVFNRYTLLAKEDDALFEKIEAMVEAIKLFNQNNHKENIFPFILPESLDLLLLQQINNNIIEEYKRWSCLLLDKQQILHFHLLFCERAIETNRIDILQELFSLESFDINCVITKLKMTPLEFFIDQSNLEGVQRLLDRQDLNVNLNNPLLKAVSEEQTDLVILLLLHPAIDVNASQEFCGPNALWLATKYGFLEIVQELLLHPKINVDYQCSKLSEKELEFLKNSGKNKMSALEVAKCYSHQEIEMIIKEHKDLLASKRAALRSHAQVRSLGAKNIVLTSNPTEMPSTYFSFPAAVGSKDLRDVTTAVTVSTNDFEEIIPTRAKPSMS